MTILRSAATVAAATAAGVALMTATTATLATAAPTAAKAVVTTHKTSLGTFLVNGKGQTLYLFVKDKKNRSTCSGTCAEVLPPALAPAGFTAEGKAKKGLIGTIKRKDGTRELTYDGHPLYTYEGDQKKFQTTGQGIRSFGAPWYVVQPSGSKIDND